MWNLAIRRRITFIMIYLAVVGFGIYSLTRLNPELLPNISMPIAGVIARYPGAGPEEVENLVTKPIEEAVATVNGATEITSTIREGTSMTIIKFTWGYDMDQAAFDIRDKIDLIEGFLPQDVEKPMVVKFDPTMLPVSYITLSGDRPLSELRKIAEDKVKPELERTEGVASADVFGGLKREIQVNLDKQKMEGYGITADDVVRAIRAQNITMPGGKVDRGDKEFTVRTLGEFDNIEQIKNTIVTVKGTAPVYINDVATVLDAYEEKRAEVRIEGKSGVLLQVQKESGAVTVDVSKKVRDKVENLKTSLPKDVTIAISMDQAEFIKKTIGDLTKNIFQGAILAIIILFLFLHNVRSTLIIGVVIPISIIATFVAMDAFGLTLNMMSMGGLALAVGMLVDNSIVVLENVFRHREEGMGKKEGASLGTREVAMPVIASTITTLAIFLPVMLVPGMVGIMSRDLSLTVAMSLTISLLVALTLIPLLTSMFLRLRGEEVKERESFVDRVSDFMGNLLKKLDNGYQSVITWSLNHKKPVVFGTLGLLVLSILLIFPFRFVGTEFIPQIDEGFIVIDIKLPEGSRLEETGSITKQVEKIVANEIPERKSVSALIGGVSEMMLGGQTGRTSSAMVNVELVDRVDRKRSQEEIEEVIRPKLNDIPGAKITLAGGMEMDMALMGMGGNQIMVEIYGHDFEELEKIAFKVKDAAEGIRGVRDVKLSREEKEPEIQLHIDRRLAQSLGIPVYTIANAVNANVRGTVASFYREGGEEYNIRVRLNKEDRKTINDILSLPLRTPYGRVIKLSQIVTPLPALGPRMIEHKGQDRIISVNGSIVGRDLGSIVREIKEGLKDIVLPEGYTINIGGQAEEQQKSFMWLSIAFIGAIFLVYMVMASLFESLIDPFTIMFTILLAAIGVIWMLFFTRTTFSVMAFVGLIILVGIVVNNGIVLIHYINLLRREYNKGLREAIILGGRRRLRPILMTALTTIFAMIPMAIGLGRGAEIRMPMARAVVGGLLVSTLLTLVFLPVLYSSFESVIERIKARRGKLNEN